MGNRRDRKLMTGGLVVVGACAVAFGITAMRSSRGPQQYSDRYFADRESAVEQSSRVVVDRLAGVLPEFPASVVDVGSGPGAWLVEFQRRGTKEILGIDGPWLDKSSLLIPASSFRSQDLEQSLVVNRTFDLAVNLEVAEHLSRSRAESFVSDLTRLAPIVLFSAAIPGQGGTGHINEEWPDYWARVFARHDYLALDVLRPALWADARISYWYRQNLVLYVRADRLPLFSKVVQASLPADSLPLRLVHPDAFEAVREELRYQTGLKQRLRGIPRAVGVAVRSRLGRNSQ